MRMLGGVLLSIGYALAAVAVGVGLGRLLVSSFGPEYVSLFYPVCFGAALIGTDLVGRRLHNLRFAFNFHILNMAIPYWLAGATLATLAIVVWLTGAT